MKHADIVIIGGGPAGLAAAISAGRAISNRNIAITLLEGNPDCGNKLLLSGKGQCNFSNNLPIMDFLNRCGKNANYLKAAYYNFDKDAFIQLLAEAGCPSFARPDNKIFPISMHASDVRDALVKQAVAAGVTIQTHGRVASITVQPPLGFLLNLDSGKELSCTKLIIATGGASYPQTGSNGKGLELAKTLGHKTIPFRSHLGNVSIRDFKPFTLCAGISLPDIRATFKTNETSFSAAGDLLITHTGFSGPLILDNCHNLAKGTEMSISWAPDALAGIQKAQAKYPNMEILNALWELPIPRKLLKTILEEKGLDTSRIIKRLSPPELISLAAGITNYGFNIAKVENIETCMASAGGVPLAEINAKTMQSRLCPGLFFAGEIMDYNLPTGGFNIQMAASTGWLAGLSAVTASS